MKYIALLALTVSLAAGQTRAEKGRKVVDEMIAALGGEKFLSMKDRVESGRAYSFYRERLTGLSRAKIYTRYLIPDKPGTVALEERQSFGKDKDDDSGAIFALGKGWRYSFRGAQPMPDDMYRRFEESTLRNVFYILRQRLKEPGMTVDFRGNDVLDNSPVEIIDLTDSENRTTTVYVNASTKLPARQTFTRRDPKTRDRDDELTIYSKYRDVGGGVQWPFAIQRQRNGEKIFEMYADSVTVDQSLLDDLFRVEGKMKILPMK